MSQAFIGTYIVSFLVCFYLMYDFMHEFIFYDKLDEDMKDQYSKLAALVSMLCAVLPIVNTIMFLILSVVSVYLDDKKFKFEEDK